MYKSILELCRLETPEDLIDANLDLDENMMYRLNQENYDRVAKLLEQPKNKKYVKCREIYNNADFASFSNDKWTEFVSAINAENSTRASKEAVKELSKLFFCRGKEKGWCFDVNDIDELVTELHDKGYRYERSLVSKVIKCYTLWGCKDGDKGNKFVVNDAVVRSVLPYYLKYYKVWPSTTWPTAYDMDYFVLSNLVEKLQKKVNLSKHQIDQIIWYCYKSDGLRIALTRAMFYNQSMATMP